MGLPEPLRESFEVLEQLESIMLLECFRVRRKSDRKECILKVLQTTAATNGDLEESFRQFFLKYGQIPGRRVPQRLDLKALKGVSYIVEEYVPGKGIPAMAKSPTSLEEVVRVLEDACEALNLAHLKGVYHLCLRPEHITLATDSSVKLAGFGSAIFLNTEYSTKLVDRSKPFCAPEVAKGLASEASDVYSLAALIANCFPEISKSEVLLQALATEPGKRFPNILSFQAELMDVFIPPPPPPPPPPVIEKLIIHVQPSGAEILVRGKTDLTCKQSPGMLEIFGEHDKWRCTLTVEVRKSGYRGKDLTIKGPPATDEYHISLDPIGRIIIIKTQPAEARVRTAERNLGVTHQETGLEVTWSRGTTLIVEKEGYESATYPMPPLPPSDLTEQTIHLLKKETSLRIIDQILARVTDARRTLAEPELAAFGLPPAHDEFTQWIHSLEERRFRSTQRFSVMLLGEYSSGKSTLLNALLELPKDKRLPVLEGPATAKPTRLTYRNPSDPEASWIMHDMTEVPKTWGQAIGQASTQAGELNDDIREIKLYLDHPFLRQADILDMPGTGTGWFNEHTDITREYLKDAEMVIFVVGKMVPGREVARDFLALKTMRIPFAVVFNAWGCLDPEEDRSIRQDQELIESTVRKDFPWAFDEHPGSRIFSQKCVEAQGRKIAVSDAWGLRTFNERFQQACLDDFLQRSSIRRGDIRNEILREALTSADYLRDCLQQWRLKLAESGNEGREAERFRRRVDSVERTIRRQVGELAGVKTKEILDRFFYAGVQFIEANLRFDDKFRKRMVQCLTQEGRRSVHRELNDELTRDYLQINRGDNWLEKAVGSYLEDCLPIIRAEWESLAVKTDVDLSRVRMFRGGPQLSSDQLTRAVIEGTQALLRSLLGAGTVFGIMLLIPGKIILDIVIALGVLILQGNPMALMRKRATERLRIEIDQQHTAFRQDLVDFVMNGANADYRNEVQRQRASTKNKSVTSLERGIRCLQELQQFLVDVGCEGN